MTEVLKQILVIVLAGIACLAIAPFYWYLVVTGDTPPRP